MINGGVTPIWAARPSIADLALYRPLRAKGGGHVELSCSLQYDGALNGCFVIREEPSGQGFGQAALKVAPYYRAASKPIDQKSILGRTVRVPVDFPP